MGVKFHCHRTKSLSKNSKFFETKKTNSEIKTEICPLLIWPLPLYPVLDLLRFFMKTFFLKFTIISCKMLLTLYKSSNKL